MEQNKMSTSGMKSYKLNKTFENSIYPLEQELKSINKTTIWRTLSNLSAAVFSGIGTSILFEDNCIPKILNNIYDKKNIGIDTIEAARINIIVVIALFIILFLLGLLINKITKGICNSRYDYKKKKNQQGRSELAERFHKIIINDIVTGLSFVDKSEELQYSGSVAEMYLYEASYYFIQAKLEMEYMELLNPEKNKNHLKFIDEIGENTIISTCKVYKDGLNKLFAHLPKGTEKGTINKIIQAIEPYTKNIIR